MTSDNRDRSLRDALRALADETSAGGPSPAVEAMLRREVRLRTRLRRPLWAAWAAALAACIAGLLLLLPQPRENRARQASFTPWYYNQGLPPARQGGIVRVVVSRSVAGRFGVPVPASSAPDLTADLFIGEDGMTRAIRFVK